MSELPRLDRVLGGLLAAIVVLLVLGIAWHLAMPVFERALGSTANAPASAAAVPTSPAAAPTSPGAAPTSPVAQSVATGHFVLRTHNALGRSGALFLPKQAASGPRPLLVLFHGTGGSGLGIVNAFLPLAEQRGIVLLAPDSGRSPDGSYNWQVPDQPGETTPDQQHAKACLDEAFGTPGLAIDTAHVLAAGHSGGASSAAYQATSDPRFRAFAVLHGGVFPRGLGQNRVPGWFSTGADDSLRPPEVVKRAAAAAAPHASTVVTHVYPGGHGLSEVELRELIAWWLGT